MKIAIEQTQIDGVLVVIPPVHNDHRGFFLELFRADEYAKHGLPATFVQLNHSGSVRNTVRGLHFQWDPPMGKLMWVSRGSAFLVAVDIRKNSPTLSKWFGAICTDEERRLIWAPAGFARGFAVLSDYAEVQYLTTATYNQAAESGILWNDPDIGVEWPVRDPILSARDSQAQTLSEWLSRPAATLFSK